jgi:hypothetical protein
MIPRLIKDWWLLGLCVALEATIAMIYFNYAGHGINRKSAVVPLGELTLAAGVCTIAAGILRSAEGKRWLLVLNGAACSALGLILTLATTIAFRTIALLIIVMAVSLAGHELASAGRFRWRMRQWLPGTAGVVLVGFATVFLAFVLRWIKLDPAGPAQTLFWLGSYFGFSAICMLGMAADLET